MSSSRTPITDNPPPLSLEDYCGKMVVAILPGARKRKGETNQGRIDRKAYQSKMEDKMADLNDRLVHESLLGGASINEGIKSDSQRCLIGFARHREMPRLGHEQADWRKEQL